MNAPENIVRMKRGKIETHYSKSRTVPASRRGTHLLQGKDTDLGLGAYLTNYPVRAPRDARNQT